MSFFISSRSLLWSILSSQTDPPTLKNYDFTSRILTFLKNHRFRSKDGFESVFGALPGSFWELLGVPGELFRASGSTKEGLQIRLRVLLGLVCSLLAAEDGLGSADVVFYLLSEPLVVDFELPN